MTISSGKTQGVRVALVGYGLAGSVFHAPLIGATPQMVLGAIVARSQEKARKAAQDFPSCSVFPDVQEILDHAQDYDLLVVASPNNTHFDIAKRSLEAGLNVVVDKPMATNYAECMQLVDLSKSKNRLLSVFQNRRWDSDFLTARHLIESGQLGKVTRFESRFERWRPTIRPGHWREAGGPEEAGGMLYDLGSHLIDQALTLFGTPEQVYCEKDIRRPGGRVDDDAFVALSFADGIHAHLWASAIACSGGPRYQIFGTRGTYRKFGLDPQEDRLRAGQTPGADWGKETPDMWGELTSDEEGKIVTRKIESIAGNYPAYYAGVRDAILNGSTPPVDAASSAQVIRIIEECL
jgi:predicted dehydrogenase